jgi:hypothetical protein
LAGDVVVAVDVVVVVPMMVAVAVVVARVVVSSVDDSVVVSSTVVADGAVGLAWIVAVAIPAANSPARTTTIPTRPRITLDYRCGPTRR